MNTSEAVKLALVDDHTLFRKGLIGLIEYVDPRYRILFEAENGSDLQTKLNEDELPDIVLMDVNMPKLDGYATMQWLNDTFPKIKVLVVSMIEHEESIMKMLKLGAKGYLTKDVEPTELREALHAVMNKGYYYTDFITGKLIESIQNGEGKNGSADTKIKLINDQEMKFLQFACSELTYFEIAEKMYLSPKTIDGYRKALFEKLGIKSRVGLTLFAIKNRLVLL
jgi:two-component system invasion response regulator UvrY